MDEIDKIKNIKNKNSNFNFDLYSESEIFKKIEEDFSVEFFLRLVAYYFHGIFLVTMLDDKNSKSKLHYFIKSNKDYFHIIGDKNNQTKIFLLSKLGAKKFGKVSRANPENYFMVLEYALINSLMWQFKSFQKYSMSPNLKIEIDNKIYVLDFVRTGIPKNFESFDSIITYPKMKKFYEENKLTKILEKIFIPKPFEYFIF